MEACMVQEVGPNERGRCVVTQRAVSAGALLLVSQPQASVVADDREKSLCHYCLSGIGDGAAPCSSCCRATYCSAQCQDLDAGTHSGGGECAALSQFEDLNLAPGESTVSVRLLIRVAACAASEPRAGDKESPIKQVLSLEHHSGQVDKAIKAAVKDVARALAKILPPLQPPSKQLNKSELTQLFFAVQSNAHAICDRAKEVKGLGLFPMASMLNHSCAPNAHHYQVLTTGALPTVEFRALQPIAKGEEVCYSYLDRYQPVEMRQSLLRRAYFFNCVCQRCQPPVDAGQAVPEAIALQEEMVGGLGCNCSRGGGRGSACDGVMVGWKGEGCQASSNQGTAGACHLCGAKETAEAIWGRYEASVKAAEQGVRVAAAVLQKEKERPADLKALQLARASVDRAITQSTLHKKHFLHLRLYTLGAQVSRHLVEAGVQNKEEIMKERIAYLVKAVTCVRDCIGGYSSELGDLYGDLAEAVEALGESDCAEELEELEAYGLPKAASSLAEMSRELLRVCFGDV